MLVGARQVSEQGVRAIGPLLIWVAEARGGGHYGGGGQVCDGGAGEERGQLAGGREACPSVTADAGVPAVESLCQEVAGAERALVLQVTAALTAAGVQAVTAGPLLLLLLHVLHHGAGWE